MRYDLFAADQLRLPADGQHLFAEIYSASPSHRRECTYYIAVGYYKLQNYAHARKFNGGHATSFGEAPNKPY